MIKFGTLVIPPNTTIQNEFVEGSDRIVTSDGQSPFSRGSVTTQPTTEKAKRVYKKSATSTVINSPENNDLPAKKSVVRKSLGLKSSQYLKDTLEGE